VVQHEEAALVDWPSFPDAVYLQEPNSRGVSYVLDQYKDLTKIQKNTNIRTEN